MSYLFTFIVIKKEVTLFITATRRVHGSLPSTLVTIWIRVVSEIAMKK